MVSSRSRFQTTVALGAIAVAGLIVTAHVVLLARQMSALRYHSDTIGQSRLEAVQLLRIQADLNQTASLMRDLIADPERSIAASASQFDRLHKELGDAIAQHTALTDSPDQKQFLATPMSQFWDEADRMLALARNGHEPEARTLLRLSLQRQHAGLATTTAFMLLDNNEEQGQAAEQLQNAVTNLRRQAIWLPGTALAMLALAAILVARSRPPRGATVSSPGGDTRATHAS
jgi:hypothetical protein